MWALILAPVCLPSAIHLYEKNIAKNIIYKLVQTDFFHGGHFVFQTAMGEVSLLSLSLIKTLDNQHNGAEDIGQSFVRV